MSSWRASSRQGMPHQGAPVMAALLLRLLKSPRAWAVSVMIGFALVALVFRSAYPRGELSRLDPALPCRIEFGRGSGWHGLDTVLVLEDGTVVLHRLSQEDDGRGMRRFVETASLNLTAESLAEVREAVEKNRLLELSRRYHGGAADGTQWVLWVRQGD